MSTCRILYGGKLLQPVKLLPFSNLLVDVGFATASLILMPMADAMYPTHFTGEKPSLFGVCAKRHHLYAFWEYRLDEIVPYTGTIQLGLGWNEGLMMFECMEIVALKGGYLVPL